MGGSGPVGVDLGGAVSGMTTFPTALGPCGIAWSARGIAATQLPGDSDDATRAALVRKRPDLLGAELSNAGPPGAEPPTASGLPASHTPESVELPPHVQSAIDRITALLAGETHDDLIDITLDLAGLSDLLQRIYTVARHTPPGTTRTYGDIAAAVGNPGLARVVGRAMGANPLPILVPCHRVTGADGAMGGFSAPGGALTKRRMLLAEGVAEQDGPALFGPDELYPRSETPR